MVTQAGRPDEYIGETLSKDHLVKDTFGESFPEGAPLLIESTHRSLQTVAIATVG